MVEEARLESVYTPKAYRGFESPSLRQNTALTFIKVGAFFYSCQPFPAFPGLFHGWNRWNNRMSIGAGCSSPPLVASGLPTCRQ